MQIAGEFGRAIIADICFQQVFIHEIVIDTPKETKLTVPIKVTAGSLRADGFIPTEVINICKVSDLRPVIFRFPVSPVHSNQYLQIVFFVDLPIIISCNIERMSFSVSHFTTNMVRISTVCSILPIAQAVCRHSTFSTC